MVTKKDLIVVALATFCLTATLFLIVPTKSQNSRYNPWLDTNDDGLINIVDITQTARAFASSGDPTKNVTVVNWQPEYEVRYLGAFNLTADQAFEIRGQCGGYGKMTFIPNITYISNFGFVGSVGSFEINILRMSWGIQQWSYPIGHTVTPFNLTITWGSEMPYSGLESAKIETEMPYFEAYGETNSHNSISTMGNV
jgi:hypothetical protein